MKHIYIFNYLNAMPSAVAGVKDIFTIANQQSGQSGYRVTEVTTDDLKDINNGSILFIPPCLSSDLPSFSELKNLTILQQFHKKGAVIVAVCAGVFWLAKAGLLDGRKVTTHWNLCSLLMHDYPLIKQVCEREILVDEGEIITAAGLYAYQDLTLHLIARCSGYSLAKKVADFCLLDLNGRLQSYYKRFYPDFTHGDRLIVKAQEHCLSQIRANLTVSNIARYCHVSERTLLRRFKRATHLTPKQYIIQLKMEKAKQWMENENKSIESICHNLGYSDVSNFIKMFKKVTGITPSDYKLKQRCSQA